MRIPKFLAAGVAVLLCTGLSQGRPAVAAAVAPAAVDAGRTATLITGDRVTVTPDGGVSVVPGAGRARVPMSISTVSGHVQVVPADALALVHSGRLDPRLFDVTGLLADGYDDRRADLPIIASDGSGASGTIVRRMVGLKSAALHTRKRDLVKLWPGMSRSAATGKVWLDAIGHFTGAEGVQQIGAPAAWQAGLTGSGLTVAVIDSGVDVTHPDLAGRVAAQVDFSPLADGGTPTSTDVHDVAGHGTTVASIMAGSGAASDGRYRGVAPDATIVSAKVGDYDVAESSVIAAMEWAAGAEHASVVNMSLAFPDAPGDDPMETALNALSEQYGTLFVVGAGNDGNNGDNPNAGADYQTESPSTADDALSVGAVDHDNQLADFSSRGPRLGDDAIKPDLTAPGVDITGARSADSDGEGAYQTGSGTSFATPHVAGSAILLKQEHPGWTGGMLKAALIGTARANPSFGVFAQGAGRVDVATALAEPVLADPPSLSFGTSSVHKTVTYRNPGTVPQTLHLALTADGPDMKATAGLFTLSRSAVIVAAGGSAEVTVDAAVPATAPAGPYSGLLTATTADGKQVKTPFGLIRPGATHTLTLHHLDHTGEPATEGEFETVVVGLDTPFVWDYNSWWLPGTGSDIALQVPEGHYAIVSDIYDQGDEGITGEHLLARPSLTVKADTSLTLDARVARPARVTAPVPGAVLTSFGVEQGIHTKHGWVSIGGTSGGTSVSTAQLGRGSADFASEISVAFGDGSDPSAYAYQLAWLQPGTLPTGFLKTVTRDQLAVDHASVRPAAPTGTTEMDAAATFPGYPLTPTYGWTPRAATRYFTPGDWTSQTFESSDDGVDYWDVTTAGTPVHYLAGHSYASIWNAPVIAPCPLAGNSWTGDQLSVRVSPFCDSAGHAGSIEQGVPTGTTTLYRNGHQVATADVPGHALFTVTPVAGRYRLNVDTSRAASFGLSTQVTADWTFADPAAVGDLAAVRLTPALDSSGAAPAGRALDIPIAVDHATGVDVQVSYDDGTTWHPAAVTRRGEGTFDATVMNPAGPGFASLRVTARGGPAPVTETILRAYRF